MTTKSKSLVVTLKISSTALTSFPYEPVAPPVPESASNSPPSDAPQINMVSSPADTPADSATAMNGTSTPSSLAPPASASDRATSRKGPKPGTKRNAAAMEATAATAKARGKPGPKRKKLGDMLNDPNEKGPFAAPAPLAKLGPKANMGIINQNLRALDRTGKFKCRKWEKRGLRIRSFTGVLWEVPSFKAAPRHANFPEDVKSDSTGSSADSKTKDESSAVSESGLNGDGGTPGATPRNRITSSPAPMLAA